jgi:stage V sporulation protein D (sporulation-specific penicillin-binding protein)
MQEKQDKQKKKKVKKFKYWMQTSLVVVFGVVVAFFLALMLRLAFLSGEDKYEKSALAQQSYVSSVIPYKRGSILDRNGNVLAASDLIYHLILDPKVLLNKEENVDPTIEALVKVYGFSEAELRSIIVEKKESSYVVLRR